MKEADTWQKEYSFFFLLSLRRNGTHGPQSQWAESSEEDNKCWSGIKWEAPSARGCLALRQTIDAHSIPAVDSTQKEGRCERTHLTPGNSEVTKNCLNYTIRLQINSHAIRECGVQKNNPHFMLTEDRNRKQPRIYQSSTNHRYSE